MGHASSKAADLRERARLEELLSQGDDALWNAVYGGNVDDVELLVRHGASKQDMLKLAAGSGKLEVVTALIRLKADVNSKDKYGRTALMCAASSGRVDVAVQLIEYGAKVNAKDVEGRTALMHAAKKGHAKVAVQLIRLGADVNTKCSIGKTALTLAGRAGHMEIFEALVRADAPVNVYSNADGETPLISVARFDNFPAVSLLVTHGNGGDRVLRFEDVQDDEYPLLPGSLTTMKMMCAAVAFELEPVCARMMTRLQDVCSALQQQYHHRVSRAAPVKPTASSSVYIDAIVTFARIVYRACRLLFEIEKKRNVLSRFVASRAILRRIQDIDDELDNFARVQCLMLGGEATSASDPRANDDDSVQQVQTRFEQALRSDDADISIYHSCDQLWVHTTAVLLQYELALCRREPSQQAQANAVEALLTHFLCVYEMKTPDVPVWFISRDDLEYHSWNSVKTDREVECYDGKWRGTSVTIEASTLGNSSSLSAFMATASQWHELNHPNVVKLFGACHIDTPGLFVYESTPSDLPLHEFLRLSESSCALTWKLLYDAALGLQHIHSRGAVHGCLQSQTIFVNSALVAKLSNVGGDRWRFQIPERPVLNWMAPELARDSSMMATSASDIFALGMCIWEAVTLKLPWQGVGHWTVEKLVKGGQLPKRPVSMRDSEWEMINEMCASDPIKRVSITHVVRRLKQFVRECEQVDTGTTNTKPSSSSTTKQTKIESKRVDEHWFVDLGRTIPSTLVFIKTRCERLPDAQWMLTRVLPALEFVFTLLQEGKKTPGDIEVVTFCAALARLQRYVRTAVSDKSAYQQMRSRKVAESHHLVYAELDQLLDMLHVAVTHAIRVWQLDEASSIVSTLPAAGANAVGAVAIDADVGACTDDVPHIQPTKPSQSLSDAITLSHLDTPPAIYKQWTREGLAKAAAFAPLTWRPKWYLSLRELVFSETDKIGQGAFGAVCKGRWLDTQVVIKFTGYEEDIDTISTDLLLHEVRVWHRLRHPHVLRLYGACHVDKRYFVCEFAGNGDLMAYLKQPGNKHLAWSKLHEAALGLRYLHRMGIAHNDLKCDNIMVGTDHKAKLIDFGLSCLLGEAEIYITTKCIGAVNWRSPEYLAGGRPSRASDVYSFAMCIIEVVSGKRPWGKMLPVAIKNQVNEGNTPPLPESMTVRQRNLIELMTKHDPSGRASMAFVVNKLSEIAHDENEITNDGSTGQASQQGEDDADCWQHLESI